MTTLQKIKVAPFYFKGYCIDLPIVLMHEFSHYILGAILWLFGFNSFPKLYITRNYRCDIQRDNSTITYSWQMHISTYSNTNLSTFSCGIIASGPMFMTIILFYSLPFWFYPVLLMVIDNLWLSITDVDQVLEWFTIFKPKERTQTSIANNKETKE